MRTLVISTGRDKEIMETWLPTLRQQGKYDGEILLLDYDMSQTSLTILQADKNIVVKKVERVYQFIPADRMRAIYECLKDNWQNYDIILLIDADIEFFKPIAPLFELAKEKLCYVKEGAIMRHWKHDCPEKYLVQFWEKIKNYKIINCGMIIGPSKMVLETVKFIAENLPIANSCASGAEQIWLNILIYCYNLFPSQSISDEWNFDIRPSRNVYTIKDGKYYNEKHNEIAILHRIGTRHPHGQRPHP